jgi:hypothetical protein
VCSAVKSASLNSRLRSDDLVHEVCGLTEPVLNLCLDSDTNDRSPSNFVDDSTQTTDPSLVFTACQALDSLRVVLSSLKDEGLEYSDVQPVGVSLTEGLRFLKLLPPDLLGKATLSLSCLPLCLDHSSLEEADNFCSLLLRSCQNNHEDTATHSVLERVVLIFHHFGGGAPDGDVLKILLSSRSIFVSTRRLYSLWRKCLQLLASNSGSGANGIEVSIARDLLESSSPIDDE